MSSGDSRSREGAGDAIALMRSVRAGVRLLAGWKIAAAVAAVTLPLLLFAGFFMAASGSAVDGGGESCRVVGDGGGEIPANYVPWLEKAAVKYELGPKGFSIVAAIHSVESDFGRSSLPGVPRGTQNSAGAEGPGQFLVSSWETYGQDADGDGVKDVYGIPDSIYGTANYMHLSGAPKDWHGAIFAYNHAEWYVEKVLQTAEKFSGHEVCSDTSIASLGELPSGKLKGVEYVARWIEAKKIHYCWGGGHGAKPGPSEGSGEFCPPGTKGLDCSGAVRWLLVLSGYPDPGGLVSNELGAHYPSGPGRYVTIYSNVDHVFVTIDGRDWGTGSSHFAHGPAYGAQAHAGFVASHPPGL